MNVSAMSQPPHRQVRYVSNWSPYITMVTSFLSEPHFSLWNILVFLLLTIWYITTRNLSVVYVSRQIYFVKMLWETCSVEFITTESILSDKFQCVYFNFCHFLYGTLLDMESCYANFKTKPFSELLIVNVFAKCSEIVSTTVCQNRTILIIFIFIIRDQAFPKFI